MTVAVSLAAIELAMLARLRAVADAGRLGFAWKTLATFPENWADYLESDADIRTPAAWVTFAGWNRTERTDNDELIVDASFGLLVAEKNERSDEQFQRHGAGDVAIRPGSYRLVTAAVTTLAGQSLDMLTSPIAIGPLRPVAATDASRMRGLSTYAVELNCRFPLALVGDGEIDPAALLALHANWDVPLFGAPIPIDADPVARGDQLPDDPRADATDHLTLGEDQP